MGWTEQEEIGLTASPIANNSLDYVAARPARTIGPTRRSVSGFVVLRNGKAVPHESTLERDFIVRKDFFVHVLDVLAQPVAVPFTAPNGREYRYTPDFLVVYRAGNGPPEHAPRPELVEVKPSQEWRANWRRWRAKWKAARRYATERGWRFRIHDETRIRDQALSNIQWLERYRRASPNDADTDRIFAWLEGAGQATFTAILDEHFGGIYRSEGIAHLWHLLATRQLDCDISFPLGNDTELWVPEHD